MRISDWSSDVCSSDLFKGKRCFIIGNGPSLNKIDLSLLRNEYSFAVNSFYYKTREIGFRPTFFVVEDSTVIKENKEEIISYEALFKFFPSIYKSLHPKQPGRSEEHTSELHALMST